MSTTPAKTGRLDPHHGLESKHELHVSERSHQSGQKSVRSFQKVHYFVKVLNVSVLHDVEHLS